MNIFYILYYYIINILNFMNKYLRNGKDDSDDEFNDTEIEPEIENSAPEIGTIPVDIPVPKATPVKKATKKQTSTPKIPNSHVCGECGEAFARNTCLTRHIKELRCPVKRKQTLSKEAEYDAREKRLRDLETEITNKILKSQEKIKKPRKKREVKAKVKPTQTPQQQKQQQPQKVQVGVSKQTQPQKKKTCINF
jgi:hypothetical protein